MATTSSQIEPKYGSCKEHTPLVEDQKTEGHCVFIQFADMASTTIRMVAEGFEKLQLSPGPMADHDLFGDNKEIAAFVSDPDLGLETIGTYPYERLERSHKGWGGGKKYRNRNRTRYYLVDIKEHCKGTDPNQKVIIKEKLMEHFLKEGHHKLPWVGDLYTGTLNDVSSAKQRVDDGTIYLHTKKEYYDKPATHSVLIVGIDVSADNPDDHYVEVKCSWGEKYGEKGFTRVHFDVFTRVWYPCQDEDGKWFGTSKGPSKDDLK